MFHATTADRNASGAGEVISEDHRFGYVIHELCVSKAEGNRLLEVEEGTSLYCVGGRGWAFFPGANARYALERGTVYAVTTPGRAMVINAVEDLTMLRVDHSRHAESGGQKRSGPLLLSELRTPPS